ncbi:MAG: CPBP family intramembrane metalloprotease [Sphingobacterium sp.]|nr:CPBP family intramembrane metalloprotease [Sphingobacterium sp.]
MLTAKPLPDVNKDCNNIHPHSIIIVKAPRRTKEKMFLQSAFFTFSNPWFFPDFIGRNPTSNWNSPARGYYAQWDPHRRIAHAGAFPCGWAQNHLLLEGDAFPEVSFAALIPVGVGLVILLVRSFMSIELSVDAPTYGSLSLPLILWMLGALGEELGWRGYLHKKLDTRMRGLFSSLLVGLAVDADPCGIFRREGFSAFLILLIISYSVVIYALVQDTGFNVLLASIFHLAINLTNLLFLDVIYETSLMMVKVVDDYCSTRRALEKRISFSLHKNR